MITNTRVKTAIIVLYRGAKPNGSWLEKLLGPFNKKYPYGLLRMKTIKL